MHSIGNYIVKNNNKKVLYITSENFVNDFDLICEDMNGTSNKFNLGDLNKTGSIVESG